jgi:hypothetical protein
MSIVKTIHNIRETWAVLFPGAPVPDQRQCALWLTLHPEKTVREAIAKLAIKQQNGTAPTTNLDRFASSIMQRVDSQREQRNGSHTSRIIVHHDADDNIGNRA